VIPSEFETLRLPTKQCISTVKLIYTFLLGEEEEGAGAAADAAGKIGEAAEGAAGADSPPPSKALKDSTGLTEDRRHPNNMAGEEDGAAA
jgi:hypothetical protein